MPSFEISNLLQESELQTKAELVIVTKKPMTGVDIAETFKFFLNCEKITCLKNLKEALKLKHLREKDRLVFVTDQYDPFAMIQIKKKFPNAVFVNFGSKNKQKDFFDCSCKLDIQDLFGILKKFVLD